MKKYFPIIFILSAVKLIIQLIGNRNYGFHRDELLHLSVSEHLDWGYMEFPPFIALLGKIAYFLFDYSLLGVRLFPTLAGIGILIFCCLIAKELGGKSAAIFLAGICILAFLPFYRNHTLFQPVAFNQLFWIMGFYLLIRFINSQNKNFLILLGVTFGLGLLTKYTTFIWGLGVFTGMFFYNRGALLKNKWLYISSLVSLAIIFPNLLWQIKNDFPVFKHLNALNRYQLNDIDKFEFGMVQLMFPITLIVSLIGLYAFLLDSRLKKFRSIGIAVLVIFFTMWILKAKAYYFFGIYPVLFAGGSVQIEQLLSEKTRWIYAMGVLILASSFYFIPEATPVLPIKDYVKYAGLNEENNRVELNNDYADMFGWEEQVKLTDSIYQALSPEEKMNCVIWAENYGEAGAIKILGKKYGLPNPISTHGSFWLWGYGQENAAVWISVGNEEDGVNYVFEDVKLVKIIRHKYAIDEENNIPIYICRNPKIAMDKWWKESEDFIY